MASDCKFKGFEKIYDSSNHWVLTASENTKFKHTKWCVTEKVHGANLCWIINEESILCANRFRVLSDSETFFGWKLLYTRLSEKLRTLFSRISQQEKLLRSLLPNTAEFKIRVLVFGELFGGIYPGLSSSSPDIKPVQTGIYYSPNIEFIAFDIAVEIDSENSERVYLNFDDSLAFLKESDIFAVSPLFIGSYTDAVNFQPRIQSGISTALGYPALSEPNIAEGVVVRPLQTLYVSTKKGQERAILKIKIPEFAEDKRFHQADKWETPSYHPALPDTTLADLTYESTFLVTTQRIENAISKVGHVEPTDKPRMRMLLDLFIQDILDQLQDSFPERWVKLTEDELSLLSKDVRRDSIVLFRSYFNLISDSRQTH